MVYVAADTYGLGILDVSNAAVPVLRGALKTPGQAKNVAFFGTTALVADHVSGIDVIDVSTPARPVLAGVVLRRRIRQGCRDRPAAWRLRSTSRQDCRCST